MAIPTIAQTIQRGDISTYLAANYNSESVLWGARKAPISAVTIAIVTDALRWGLDGGAQTAISLREVANYLIWLTGFWGQQAEAIVNGGGGGSVIPINPTDFVYLIPITGADFTDATNYDDTRIVGKELAIFWNDISRYLFSYEWEATATGFNILVPGFDATANPTYELFIYIINV